MGEGWLMTLAFCRAGELCPCLPKPFLSPPSLLDCASLCSSERSLHGWPELPMCGPCWEGDGRSLSDFYAEKSTQGIEREATCVKRHKK